MPSSSFLVKNQVTSILGVTSRAEWPLPVVIKVLPLSRRSAVKHPLANDSGSWPPMGSRPNMGTSYSQITLPSESYSRTTPFMSCATSTVPIGVERINRESLFG